MVPSAPLPPSSGSARLAEARERFLTSEPVAPSDVREPILASRRLTDPELRAHIAALSEHLADPATTLIDKLLVQAWGQKPR